MKTLPTLLALAFLSSAALAAPQHAKISMRTARAKALAVVPHGRVESAELETEKGKLIYSFDIRVPKASGVEEVQISAVDGRLVSHTHENAAKEKAEARADTKVAKHK
jgi:uncharacterized membrane protein YkoI